MNQCFEMMTQLREDWVFLFLAVLQGWGQIPSGDVIVNLRLICSFSGLGLWELKEG